jgi:hypothetical protein
MEERQTRQYLLLTGEGSKLFELNLWAMTFGRAKEQTVYVQDTLVAWAARNEHRCDKGSCAR